MSQAVRCTITLKLFHYVAFRVRLLNIGATLFALLLGGSPSTWSQGEQPSPATNISQTVTGEVVMLSDDVLILKDSTGARVLIQTGKETKRDPSVREGRKVEVQISTGGQARSVTTIKDSR